MKNLLLQEKISTTQSHWKRVSQKISHSLRKHDVLEQAVKVEPSRGTESLNASQLFGRSQTPSCSDWGWLWSQNRLQSQQGKDSDKWHQERVDNCQGNPSELDSNIVRSSRDIDFMTDKWINKLKVGPSNKSTNTKHVFGNGPPTSGRIGWLWDFCTYL